MAEEPGLKKPRSEWTFTIGDAPSVSNLGVSARAPAGSRSLTRSCGTASTTASAGSAGALDTHDIPAACDRLERTHARRQSHVDAGGHESAAPPARCEAVPAGPSPCRCRRRRPGRGARCAARWPPARGWRRRARAFSVDRMKRSQSRLIARSDWPWPASQAPSVPASRAGSAGSRRRAASAARAAARRSAGESRP